MDPIISLLINLGGLALTAVTLLVQVSRSSRRTETSIAARLAVLDTKLEHQADAMHGLEASIERGHAGRSKLWENLNDLRDRTTRLEAQTSSITKE